MEKQKEETRSTGFSFGTFTLPTTTAAPSLFKLTPSTPTSLLSSQLNPTSLPETAVEKPAEIPDRRGDRDKGGVRQKSSEEERDRKRGQRQEFGRTGKSLVFSGFQQQLAAQWRDVQWTEEQKKNLMKVVTSYRPSCKEVTQARVLLLGPVHSGKSSFISSVQSVFNGRVTNRAMVGSSFSSSFTKKLHSFNIHAQKGEENSRLELCDVAGLGDEEMSGLTLHDILSVIKGHVPEGHKFSPDQPVGPETVGYVKTPGLKEKIHCVAFVVDASKITSYHKGLSSTFKLLREHISDLGVHQVALLTHVDQICRETAKDVSHVYRSPTVKETMSKAGALLGMSTSYIVPVKNYSSELDLDLNTDVLLLRAVDHILQYTDLFFQDYIPPNAGSKLLGI